MPWGAEVMIRRRGQSWGARAPRPPTVGTGPGAGASLHAPPAAQPAQSQFPAHPAHGLFILSNLSNSANSQFQ